MRSQPVLLSHFAALRVQVADCPVYCSLAEAQAYAAHHSARIMTEAEYAAACQLTDSGASPDAGSGSGGGRCCSPPSGGILGLKEGGWEWTSSPLEPFTGGRLAHRNTAVDQLLS